MEYEFECPCSCGGYKEVSAPPDYSKMDITPEEDETVYFVNPDMEVPEEEVI